MTLGYSTVRLNVTALVIDGVDSDDLPDEVPLSGSIILSPMIQTGRTIQYDEGGELKLKALTEMEVDIGATGDISHRNRNYVKVVAPSVPATNMAELQWKATFKNLKYGTKSTSIDPIYFYAVPDAEINLADHVNVAPNSTAIQLSRGPRGFAVGEVIDEAGELVFLLDDADATEVGRVPIPEGVVSDEAVAELVSPGTATKAVLDGTYAPQWQPSTAYATGDVVLLPNSRTGIRTSAGTSAATFTTAERLTWSFPSALAGDLAYRPEEYGSTGNGTSDDGPALQAAFNSAASLGREVLLGGVAYRTNQQLEWPATAPIRVRMDPRGKIRAGAPMASVIHKAAGVNIGSEMNGINIIGNRLADRIVDIEQANMWKIRGGQWQDALVCVADFGRLGGQVYELEWLGTKIFGLDPTLYSGVTPADMPEYGYRFGVACTDSNFDNLWMKNAKTLGVDAGGGNIHKNEHIYGYPVAPTAGAADYTATVGILLSGSHIRMTAPYMDTQLVGIRVTGAGNAIMNPKWWAPADWANTTDVIAIDVIGNQTTILGGTFTIPSAAPYRGDCVRIAAGTRDLVAVANQKQGPRWYGGMFKFLGAQNWEGRANRSDQGENIPDYTQSSPLIARGNDGDTIMAWAGANPFQVVTRGSGATGYSSFTPLTAGGGIQMGGAGHKFAARGVVPPANSAVTLTYSRTAETPIEAALRAALAAQGLVIDNTVA